MSIKSEDSQHCLRADFALHGGESPVLVDRSPCKPSMLFEWKW